MNISVHRYNKFQGRSFETEIEATTIESVQETDGRNIRCIIRTKSGDEILSSDDFSMLVSRWRAACRPS